MATRWFCKQDGREVGPSSLRELVVMIRAGKLHEDDRVRMENGTEWIAVWNVPGLPRAAQAGATGGNGPGILPLGGVPCQGQHGVRPTRRRARTTHFVACRRPPQGERPKLLLSLPGSRDRSRRNFLAAPCTVLSAFSSLRGFYGL